MSRNKKKRAAFASQPKSSELLTEQAAPKVGGVLSPHRTSQADILTPATLARLLKSADNGDVEAYFVLAEEMEEREPHYRSVLGTRKLGVSGAPRSVDAASDDAHDVAIADDVGALLDKPEAEALILDLMDGVAKGISLVEILWSRDSKRWEPAQYKFRPQRHFIFDRDTLERPLLRTFDGFGSELAPYKWIVHQPKLLSGLALRSGLARTIAVTYAAKRYTVSDWLAFMDVFGMPVRLGKYPADQAKNKNILLRALQQIGTDAAAVIPDGMAIELLQATGGSTGNTIFQATAEYWDKQTSKVVLGQTMTSDDGASLAQSKTHERVRLDIRAADARAVAATINRDLIKPFVDLNYGPQKAYPSFRIDVSEPEDTTALMGNVKTFVELGGKVQESEIRDRLGLSEPEAGADLLKSPSKAVAAPEQDDEEDDGALPTGAFRERFDAAPKTADVVDESVDAELEDWRSLADENIGVLIRRMQNATSYADARAALEQLAQDEGEEMALGVITASLARQTFKLRGVGDATDKTEL